MAGYDLDGKSVFVAGHRGMVGAAVVRALEARGGVTVLTAPRPGVDLRREAGVDAWFREARPDAVVLAAAKVGGILANDRFPADFIADNLAIELNVIRAAHDHGVGKLLFLGSSCIYPKHAPQPIPEDALLTGPLEPTNAPYAIAKIAGIELCCAYARQYGDRFTSAMPTNLYGPGDNFDLTSSHVLPALIRKFHEAKLARAASVTLWGTGRPRREFMHVDDLADALVFLLERYDDPGHINVGVSEDIEIGELARLVAQVVGWDGTVEHDLTKPDGTPRKLMDSSRLHALGWRPRIGLERGIGETYAWFLDHGTAARAA